MLEIVDLCVAVAGKEILKGISLTIKPGEIHTIMGPNGSGKSTLANVLAGHPAYEITSGELLFQGKSLIDLEPEERAHLGLFMGFQYPIEIAGVSNIQFLQIALNAKRKANGLPEMTSEQFESYFAEKAALMEIKPEFRTRNVNEGFSGGEKKRNEILQMAVLDPCMAILDETDSGLDIDAMRVVARGVNRWMTPEKGLLLITHYQRLLDYIKPHFVHVCINGKITTSGGPELALELESKGYDWLISPVEESYVA
ncbi:MAG: Fe-S cluster assembly ATPase SufC [Verrucomicrobia bacterium]|nr:Fe-S cluster assembly ATPase SufC [Verrucomicrobiota bacterium]